MGKGHTGAVLFAFLTGGLVGAGLALLFAPASGRESRERIREASENAKQKAVLRADQMRERVVEVEERAKEKLDEARLNVRAAVDAGKEAFQRTREELLQRPPEDEEA